MSSADEYFDIPRLPDEASFPTFVGAVSPFAQQQEDPVNQSSKSPAASSTPLSNAIPEGQQEEANLSSALEEGRADSPSSSIFSVDYWQFYFNVTTAQVGSRIKASFMPQTSELERLFSTSPVDLYGPFWITITIVFLYSIIGYFSSSEASSGVVIAKASTLFLTMLYLVPLLQTSFLFVLRVMKRTNNDPANSRYTKLSFLQLFLTLISYFGYTLSPYIFSAILSSFPLSAWHWIVNVAAALLSSIVYFVNSQTFFEAWLDGLFLGFAKYNISIHFVCRVTANFTFGKQSLFEFNNNFIFALLIFIGSFIFHIDKLVVIYPLSILCTCITIFSLSQHVSFHTILALTLTIICAIRLFVHLSLRIFKDKKDRRFNEVRDNVVLRGVFSFIVWLYSICSLSFVCTCCSFEEKKTLFNGIDITGLLLWLGGFMLETIGDLHLFVFKHKVMNYGLICNRGLFKVMRHPNYVGSTFWMTGLALACWNGCNGKGWIPLICSFTFCIGTNFLTGIPPAERALHSHYGNEIQYHLYVSATSIFIPVVPVIEHTMQWIRRRPQNIPPPAEAAAHPISPSLSSTSPILTPTHLQAERDLQNSPPSLFDSSSYSPAPPADVSTPPEINISPSYFRPHDSMHRPNEMKYPPSNNEDQKQDPFENKFQKQDGAGLSLLNP